MYHYVLAKCEEMEEIVLSSSPDDLRQFLPKLLEFMGYTAGDAAMVVWVRSDTENVWYPIFGAEEESPCLFPLNAPNVAKMPTEEEYSLIGRKALDAYEAIRANWVKMKGSGHRQKPTMRKTLDEFQDKMLMLESAVAGTEYEVLFDLKYKQKRKNIDCAMELHVGERTVNRQVEEMALHVGRVLHISVKPRTLQVLLEWAERDAKRV